MWNALQERRDMEMRDRLQAVVRNAKGPQPHLPAEEKIAGTMNKILSSSESITVAGVRMNASDLGAPTAVDAEGKPLITLISYGDETSDTIPQAACNTIDDLDLFRLVFPHYEDLTEAQATERGLFPYIYYVYNKPARVVELKYRKQRELTEDEMIRLRAYAREHGNNALIRDMNSGFVGYRDGGLCGFCGVGMWVCLGVLGERAEGDMRYVIFGRHDHLTSHSWMNPAYEMVVRAVSEDEA